MGMMTVADFYAFTDTRPDHEKWELIAGEPVLNAAPTEFHEAIVANVLVAFEVLSPSTKARDLTRKREACTSLASLTHYVVIAQDAVEVTVFARDDGFQSRTFRALDDVIALKSLAVSLPVAEIYRDVPL